MGVRNIVSLNNQHLELLELVVGDSAEFNSINCVVVRNRELENALLVFFKKDFVHFSRSNIDLSLELCLEFVLAGSQAINSDCDPSRVVLLEVLAADDADILSVKPARNVELRHVGLLVGQHDVQIRIRKPEVAIVEHLDYEVLVLTHVCDFDI